MTSGLLTLGFAMLDDIWLSVQDTRSLVNISIGDIGVRRAIAPIIRQKLSYFKLHWGSSVLRKQIFREKLC